MNKTDEMHDKLDEISDGFNNAKLESFIYILLRDVPIGIVEKYVRKAELNDATIYYHEYAHSEQLKHAKALANRLLI